MQSCYSSYRDLSAGVTGRSEGRTREWSTSVASAGGAASASGAPRRARNFHGEVSVVASGIQVATLIAACVSAAGSGATALVGYFRYRRETARPIVDLLYDKSVVRILVRNRSSSERTIYAVGFSHHQRIMDLLDPSRFGPSLPKVLQPGEREAWNIPYKQFREAWDQCPWWLRNSFSAYAELGDSIYRARVRSEIVRASSKALRL
jgi:hypothetical protein